MDHVYYQMPSGQDMQHQQQLQQQIQQLSHMQQRQQPPPDLYGYPQGQYQQFNQPLSMPTQQQHPQHRQSQPQGVELSQSYMNKRDKALAPRPPELAMLAEEAAESLRVVMDAAGIPEETRRGVLDKVTIKGRGGRTTAMDPRLDPTIDPKKAKRILANRISAARSKIRQKVLMETLKLPPSEDTRVLQQVVGSTRALKGGVKRASHGSQGGAPPAPAPAHLLRDHDEDMMAMGGSEDPEGLDPQQKEYENLMALDEVFSMISDMQDRNAHLESRVRSLELAVTALTSSHPLIANMGMPSSGGGMMAGGMLPGGLSTSIGVSMGGMGGVGGGGAYKGGGMPQIQPLDMSSYGGARPGMGSSHLMLSTSSVPALYGQPPSVTMPSSGVQPTATLQLTSQMGNGGMQGLTSVNPSTYSTYPMNDPSHNTQSLQLMGNSNAGGNYYYSQPIQANAGQMLSGIPDSSMMAAAAASNANASASAPIPASIPAELSGNAISNIGDGSVPREDA